MPGCWSAKIWAAGYTALQTRCLWARRALGLVKGRTGPGGPTGYVWTVEDVNHANDLTEFWWTLNTHPQNTIRTFRDHATVRGCQVGSELDVHVALLPEDQFPDPHRVRFEQDENTCRASGYTGDPRQRTDHYAQQGVHGSVSVRPRLIARVRGWNGRFLSLLLPRVRGARPARVRPLQTHYNALGVRLTFPEVEDTLLWSYEHGLLEAEEIRGLGQWCVVRRSRKTGRVVRWAAGHATRLCVDGRELP